MDLAGNLKLGYGKMLDDAKTRQEKMLGYFKSGLLSAEQWKPSLRIIALGWLNVKRMEKMGY